MKTTNTTRPRKSAEPTPTIKSPLDVLKGLLAKAPSDLRSIEPPYGSPRLRWTHPSSPLPTGKKLIYLTGHEPLIAFLNPNDSSHHTTAKEFSKASSIIVTEEILDEAAARLNLISSHDAVPILCRLVSAGEVVLVASDSKSQKLIQAAKALTQAIEGAARSSGERVAVMTAFGTFSGTAQPKASQQRSRDFLPRKGTSEGLEPIPDRPVPPLYPVPTFRPDPPSNPSAH